MRKLEQIIGMEFILSQFFTFIEFSCVILTDKIFLNSLFQLEFGKPKTHYRKNMILTFPHSGN